MRDPECHVPPGGSIVLVPVGSDAVVRIGVGVRIGRKVMVMVMVIPSQAARLQADPLLRMASCAGCPSSRCYHDYGGENKG